MPSLYGSVLEFQSSPMGQAASVVTASIDQTTLARMLMEASDEADRYTLRILGAPPTTTLAAGASPGDTTLSVTAATGIKPDDLAVLPDGSTYEVAGADVTSFVSPYPGTVYLVGSVAGTIANGTTVTFYRHERHEQRGKSTQPLDSSVDMSQTAQVALMHAPKGALSAFGRKITLNQYPVWQLTGAVYTLPWSSNLEVTADVSQWSVMREQGWVRLPLGYPNWEGTLWRLWYSAGYKAIPQDIKKAVYLLLGDALMQPSMNPLGAHELRADGQLARMTRASMSAGTPMPTTLFREQAYSLLDHFKRKGI